MARERFYDGRAQPRTRHSKAAGEIETVLGGAGIVRRSNIAEGAVG